MSSHKKTNNLGIRPVPTQISLYSHRSRLEAGNFRLRKKKDCTTLLVKTKALISYCEADLLICFRICKMLVFS